jgi:hypothetical protein
MNIKSDFTWTCGENQAGRTSVGNVRVHILDMIGVGLIDATWPARLPAPLGARLQQLLDNPNG